MKIVVLGAAGGVGRHAVRLAAERGHTVLAGARRPADVAAAAGVEARAVDVRDAEAVLPALAGADAVLWCVGVTKSSGGDVGRAALPGVLGAMDRHHVRRFVGVSGAGVTLPGDRKGPGARAISALTRRLAADLVADKEGEHDLLAASHVLWTQVRPPRLVDRDGSGTYVLGEEAPGLRAKPVAKADVALAMLDLADGAAPESWTRRAPFITAG